MLERDLQKEINRLNGALEILGLLRQRLELQLDEMGDESGQEAVDEMLTQVVAIRSEYQRRQQALHPHHKTYLFYLAGEGVLPILHDCYVPLVEGKAVACEFFSQTFRLADWICRPLTILMKHPCRLRQKEKESNSSYLILIYENI